MTLSGAMADSVCALEKAFLTVLPGDRAGRPVIFFDRIRALPTVSSRESVLQVLFYILQKLTQEEAVQSKGFVMIENICGYDLYTHFDRILIKLQMCMLRDCFPSALKAYHVCAGHSGEWAIELIMPMVKQIAGLHIRLRTVCHTGNFPDILKRLERKYRLDAKHQSVIIGGNISYAHHLNWVQTQKHYERMACPKTFASQKDDEDCPADLGCDKKKFAPLSTSVMENTYGFKCATPTDFDNDDDGDDEDAEKWQEDLLDGPSSPRSPLNARSSLVLHSSWNNGDIFSNNSHRRRGLMMRSFHESMIENEVSVLAKSPVRGVARHHSDDVLLFSPEAHPHSPRTLLSQSMLPGIPPLGRTKNCRAA